MSVRETILAAIASRLAAIPGVVEFAREATGDPTQFPAIFLTEGPHESRSGEVQTQRYAMSVLIEGYVAGGDGAAAAAARNNLYAAAAAAIMSDGLNMGGTISGVEDIAEIRFRPSVAELSKGRRAAFELELEIQFSTMRGNPALPA